METQTKPEFKGKALIEIPLVIPQIGFLEGDFGKTFLEEYQGRVDSDYKGNSALNVLRYNGNTVTGSNPFSVVLANQILRGQGLKTATQADLEKALRIGIMPLTGTYEDTGLVLRSEEDRDYSRNTPLAQDLGKQVKARRIKFGKRNPVVIPLTGLELATADNDYGLKFNLREDAQPYIAPVLAEETGSFKTENIDETTGLPRQLGTGNRTFYTRDSGLSRLYLDSDLNVSSDDRDLDVSAGVVGRVVAVSAEGTSPDFDKYLTDLQKARDREIAKVQRRYEKAEAVLKGK